MSHNKENIAKWAVGQSLEPQQIVEALMDGCHLRGPEMCGGYVRYNPDERDVEFIHPGYGKSDGTRTPPTAEQYTLDIWNPEGYRIVNIEDWLNKVAAELTELSQEIANDLGEEY